jgi:hypothetical protein
MEFAEIKLGAADVLFAALHGLHIAISLDRFGNVRSRYRQRKHQSGQQKHDCQQQEALL